MFSPLHHLYYFLPPFYYKFCLFFKKATAEGVVAGLYKLCTLLFLSLIRAGGNGTAGTAMAVLVFEGENGITWILTYACIIEWPL